MNFKWVFLLSSVLHLALFFVLFWVGRYASVPPSPTPLVVTLQGRGTEPQTQSRTHSGSQAQHPPHSGSKSVKSSKIKQLSHLGIQYGSGTRAGGGPSGAKGANGAGGPDGYDQANEMGIEQETQSYPFFEALWHKVNAATTYPEDFVQQGIRGSVRAQLGIDRRGVFTGDIRSVNGPEPYLNTLVTAVLTHALKEPLERNRWLSKDVLSGQAEITVVFDFQFRIFGPGQKPEEDRLRHMKNILSFRRDSYVDPALNRYIEKLFTRYLPPVILLPGFVYVDFYRAYQFFSSIGKTDPDVLRSRRLEMMKDQWDSVIRSSN